MPNFEIDYSYTIREGSSVRLPADNAADAEFQGIQYVRDTYDDVENIEIDGIRQLPDGEAL